VFSKLSKKSVLTSVVTLVVNSRVLTQLNVSRHVEQTALRRGLGVLRTCANSDVLVCLESCYLKSAVNSCYVCAIKIYPEQNPG
jgi:tRNA(Arg) A34 adenosine deaminase TadA